jgi:hypothetical protein
MGFQVPGRSKAGGEGVADEIIEDEDVGRRTCGREPEERRIRRKSARTRRWAPLARRCLIVPGRRRPCVHERPSRVEGGGARKWRD